MLQVPSRTCPSHTYRVSVAAEQCSCTGFQFRGRCSHLKAATQHPGRYVKVGEERSGLWLMGLSWASPDQALRFFDQARIAVLADRIVGPRHAGGKGAWAIDLDDWCKANGLHRLKFGDVLRCASMQRVCQVINGTGEFLKVRLL